MNVEFLRIVSEEHEVDDGVGIIRIICISSEDQIDG